jgi:hypothetical protein
MKYEWQMVGLVTTIVVVWALYRLYKRWTRRCQHCGSMWYFERWHEREFIQSSASGRAKGITTTYYRCNNPACPQHDVEFIVKSYPKEFSNRNRMTY